MTRNDRQVPPGWQVVRLGEVLKLEYGVSLPQRQRLTGRVPVMGSAGRVGFHNQASISGPGIVIGRKGSIGTVTWVSDDFVPIDTTYVAVPVDGLADLIWLYHLLSREDLSKLNRATGVPGLNRDDVYALIRLLPPLSEQRSIAVVLDSIDEAIERTEAVIAATERLRDALLHELLTRGVPGWHTEWKEVPGIGTIPADWEVVRLGDVIPKFEYGTSARCHREPLGIPVLRIPNIARGELDLADVKYANLSDSESANLQLAKGDILLVRTNGNPDICGKCWVTEDLERQWAFASYLVRGRPDQSRTDPAFIGHFLTSHTGRRSLRAHIRTSAGNYNLSVRDLTSIRIPQPCRREQTAIVDAITKTIRYRDALRRVLSELRSAGAATADALLTGAVRVAGRN